MKITFFFLALVLCISVAIGAEKTTPRFIGKSTVAYKQTTTIKPPKCQTISGSDCKFPFIYKKKIYNGCTKVENDNVLWCPTTLFMSGEAKKFENCNEHCSSGDIVEPQSCKTLRGLDCTFPFNYYGVEHNKCVKLGDIDPWCAVSKDNMTGEVNEWAFCNSLCQVEKPYSGDKCTTVANEECIFPFTYKGINYTGCDTVGNFDEHWCATSLYTDSNEAKDWNKCNHKNKKCNICLTKYGFECDIPFTLNGKTYNGCILDDDIYTCGKFSVPCNMNTGCVEVPM